MNRFFLGYYQKSEKLKFSNTEYKESFSILTNWYLKLDGIDSDITTNTFLKGLGRNKLTANIIAKEKGLVSGLEEIDYLLNKLNLEHKIFYHDGEIISDNSIILAITGEAMKLLSLERTVLNFLQRMSGISTGTSEIVSKVEGNWQTDPPMIASTRKTPLMLQDKKAIATGGGLTHRLSLADEIMLKDNHVAVLKSKFKLDKESDVVSKAIRTLDYLDKNVICIEVDSVQAGLNVPQIYFDKFPDKYLILLLDNFNPTDAGEVIVANKNIYKNKIAHELSGGINSRNILDYKHVSADVISLGSLTHSVRVLDLSMRII